LINGRPVPRPVPTKGPAERVRDAREDAVDAPDPLDGPDMEPGLRGPGIRPRAWIDPTVWLSAAFVLLGWLPPAWYAAVLGVGYFGPLAIPAILAIVGVLAAAIGVLRSLDLRDEGLRRTCLVLGAIGLVRLFVAPLF